MSRSRPYPIDRSAPRYNIRKARGHGQLVGCGWTEPHSRRYAARLAEQHGEAVVLLDTWRRRIVRRFEPSRHAMALAKARAEEARRTRSAGGHDGSLMRTFFLGGRRKNKGAEEELPPPAPEPIVFLGDYLGPDSAGSLDF